LRNRIIYNGLGVKELREKGGWSQEKFGLLIKNYNKAEKNYDKSSISLIESNKLRNPDKDCFEGIIKAFVDLLELSVDEVRSTIGYVETTPIQRLYSNIKQNHKSKFEEVEEYWIDSKVIEYSKNTTSDKEVVRPVDLIQAVTDSIEKNQSVVLFGDSGLGKSFNCWKLVSEFCDKKSHFPVLVELPIYNKSIEDIIIENVSGINLQKTKLVIIFDGLNQVGDSGEQEIVFSHIKEISLKFNSPIIISTQILTETLKYLKSYKFFNIQRFDEENIVNYLVKFKQKSKQKFESKEDAWDFFQDFNDHLKELISIPQMLYILGSIYDKVKPLKTFSPIQLFIEYENFLCVGRDSRIGMYEEIREYFIPFLAYKMNRGYKSKLTFKELNFIVKDYKKEYKSEITQYQIQESLVKNYNILRKSNNNEYEFNHDLVRDYFTGKYWKINSYGINKILDRIYQDSETNEFLLKSLKFYIGFINEKNAEELLESIIKKDVFLCCELFFWSQISKYENKLIERINQNIGFYDYSVFISDNIFDIKFSLIISYYLKLLNLNNLPNISLKVKILIVLGDLYNLRYSFNRSINFYKIAIKEIQNLPGETIYSIQCNYNLGNTFENIFYYDDAISCFKRASELFKKNKYEDYSFQARCLLHIGEILIEKNYIEAYKFYKEAISIYENNNLPADLDFAKCCIRIGYFYQEKKEYDKAIKYLLKAYEYFSIERSIEYFYYAFYVSDCLLNLAIAHSKLEKTDKAVQFFKGANNVFAKGYISYHSSIKCYSGLANIFHKNKNYPEAIKKYEIAIEAIENYLASKEFIHQESDLHPVNLHFRQGIYEFDQDHKYCILFFTKKFNQNNNNKENNHFFVICLNMIGICFENPEQLEMAIKFHKRSLLLLENKTKTIDEYETCLLNISNDLMKKSDYSKAKIYLTKYINLCDTNNKNSHPEYKQCLTQINFCDKKISNFNNSEKTTMLKSHNDFYRNFKNITKDALNLLHVLIDS